MQKKLVEILSRIEGVIAAKIRVLRLVALRMRQVKAVIAGVRPVACEVRVSKNCKVRGGIGGRSMGKVAGKPEETAQICRATVEGIAFDVCRKCARILWDFYGIQAIPLRTVLENELEGLKTRELSLSEDLADAKMVRDWDRRIVEVFGANVAAKRGDRLPSPILPAAAAPKKRIAEPASGSHRTNGSQGGTTIVRATTRLGEKILEAARATGPRASG